MSIYTVYLASEPNKSEITKLWVEFAHERVHSDPSITIVSHFNFEEYIAFQLSKSLTFCWTIEHSDENSSRAKGAVGFLLGRYHDESPPHNLSQTLLERHRLNHPFRYRRVGSVIAFYVQPEHRTPEAIKLLVETALEHAESMKVTDIDLMVGAHLSGLQSLLEKLGFTQTAVQYTRHYDLPEGIDLPNLHPSILDVEYFKPPAPRAIPLRDPKTGELVKSPQGEPVFLQPLDIFSETGETILPVYPTPVRNPQTQGFVFDAQGQLVVCPILRDENGKIFTHKGLPQFQTPAYEYINGKLQLKQDTEGNYIFCDAERDSLGKILCDSHGSPIFQKPLLQH